ncbi:lipoprotein-anchoring transpeptidase ErfK/SrfK [Metabacillus crassostreae]|uniref:L,D-transpeptidase n=1 Tax=Metabacillus crassostreae TaxID=929098 RepID=UPI00195C6D3E|nr:L,D-transpeptidase [Metabacillus crassostreae]MBM7604557.1 lipoprotein-anchoring transpeptidase ErfK/SrfK [Metabacillus crassostreae]
MKTMLLLFFIISSPIWPLGQNPIVGDPFIIINKQTNELAYINENDIKDIFHVATGVTEEHTPEGKFTITVKAINPYYRKKDIPGGDANNPLGTRWIGFNAKDTDGRIYGIHGTNKKESIGHYVTQGCVRLQNENVEKLYEKVPVGTNVLIINSQESFEQLGIEYGALKK